MDSKIELRLLRAMAGDPSRRFSTEDLGKLLPAGMWENGNRWGRYVARWHTRRLVRRGFAERDEAGRVRITLEGKRETARRVPGGPNEEVE